MATTERVRSPQGGPTFTQALERLYSEDGVYQELHTLAMHEGELSRNGVSAVLQRVLPDSPREAITITAKKEGGLVVSRDLELGGNQRYNRYRLLLPSSPRNSWCELVTRHGLQEVHSLLLPAYLPKAASEGTSIFVTGMNRALEDVSQAMADQRYQDLRLI